MVNLTVAILLNDRGAAGPRVDRVDEVRAQPRDLLDLVLEAPLVLVRLLPKHELHVEHLGHELGDHKVLLPGRDEINQVACPSVRALCLHLSQVAPQVHQPLIVLRRQHRRPVG